MFRLIQQASTKRLAFAYNNNNKYALFQNAGRASFSAESAATSASGTEEEKQPQQQPQQPVEKVIGEPKQHAFQAETKKLLNIVANSLYSEREVFCRELISNAADALEKRRHAQQAGDPMADAAGEELEIRVQLDTDAKQFILQDTGIGMSDSEMVELLGTIARSGSKSFVEQLEKDTAATGASGSATKDKIIGQFGVGFYSAFMVGDKISVYSRSAKEGSKGYCWTSDGLGTYTLAEAENVQVGTKIVIHLKDDAMEFCDKLKVEGIVKKYSNFIGFPIKLNGEKINTIQPIWAMDKNSVTEEQHTEFYRFIANAWDTHQYKMHFQTDAPINISSLLYVPQRHTEHMGMGRMEPGVSLYSRRVLIQPKAKKLLPEYLRFVKGVIDSEDIPMNLSREMLQDSSVLTKLSEIMTGKVIKWLQAEAKKDAEKFATFFTDFGNFLKEGVCIAEPKHQSELAKLLRYESSATEAGKTTSLEDYLSRKHTEQKSIYYLISSNRRWAEESPYYETFKAKGTEVLFLYDPIDEFVVEHLRDFKGVELKSVDASGAAEAASQQSDVADKKTDDATGKIPPLSEEEKTKLTTWFQDTLGKSVSTVTITDSIHSFPAIIRDHESPTVRRMMKMMPKSSPIFMEEAPQKLEINASHPVVRGILATIGKKQEGNGNGKEELAKEVTKQVFDNALIAAGILDDPRVMLKRLNRIMESTLDKQ